MPIRTAFEHGAVSLQPEDLRVESGAKMRQDVLRRGYVEWRSVVASDLPKDAPEEVAVERKLFAKGVIGLIPLAGNLSVLVRPRFPASVTHMVSVCEWPTTALDLVRNYAETPGAAEEWMLDRLVADFLASLAGLLSQGLMREYRQREVVTSSPKGRILVGRTIREQASRGIDYKVNHSYFEKIETTPPNQALLAAVEWSRERLDARLRMISDKETMRRIRATRQEAVRHLHALRFIEGDPERRFMDDPYVRGLRDVPEARSEYRHALRLAAAILEHRGFTLEDSEGLLGLSSLLLSTDDLFEEYVRRRLRDYTSNLEVLDGNHLNPVRKLFEPVEVPAGVAVVESLSLGPNKVQPDILVERDGRTLLVADVKYQAVSNGHADRHALEQVVTYAERLNCADVMTVHPCVPEQPQGLVLSGRIGSVRVWQYRISLAQDPDAGMREMASAVESLCR
ncbi:5-methylcytosine restriction system specificity protein McrC [Streptomyces anulatus]|uniref:5-methylcytosine restriction system specificity protein McrC n=1 Tax=Streptomyces anulatus TaxID=1892 RepID=UPI00386CEB8B|nr:McrC family protein [Streptomyces anulatus]